MEQTKNQNTKDMGCEKNPGENSGNEEHSQVTNEDLEGTFKHKQSLKFSKNQLFPFSEFDSVSNEIDSINAFLDSLESNVDNIKEQLMSILTSNREIVKELKEQKEDEKDEKPMETN